MKKQYKVDEQSREHWGDILRDIVSDAVAIKERAHDLIVEMVGDVGGEVWLADEAFCFTFDDEGVCHEKRVTAVKVDAGKITLVYEDEWDDRYELAEDSGLIEYDKIELAEAVGCVLVDCINDEND